MFCAIVQCEKDVKGCFLFRSMLTKIKALFRLQVIYLAAVLKVIFLSVCFIYKPILSLLNNFCVFLLFFPYYFASMYEQNIWEKLS